MRQKSFSQDGSRGPGRLTLWDLSCKENNQVQVSRRKKGGGVARRSIDGETTPLRGGLRENDTRAKSHIAVPIRRPARVLKKDSELKGEEEQIAVEQKPWGQKRFLNSPGRQKHRGIVTRRSAK